jgi:hypothetical protein
MAFEFTDTFCTINSTTLSPYEGVSGTVTYNSSYYRFTPPSNCVGGGVKLAASSYLRKNLSGNRATLITFLSFGALALPSTGNSTIAAWLDNGTCQCLLAVTPSGALQLYSGASGGTVTIGSPSASALIGVAPGTQPNHGIEIQTTFSGSSTGVLNVWLDGTQVMSETGLNNIVSSNAYANQIQLCGNSGSIGSSNQGFYTDYLRVWNSTGSYQNAPIGLDRQPITKLPSAAGTNTFMTPNGLTHNYQCVSVNPPNNSDYVSANGTNIIDDYVVPTSGITQAPSQVVASSYYEKDDGATRTYTNGVLSSGTVGVGNTFTANSAYTWVQNCISLDPATGNPWTASSADAAHFLHEELT